MKLPQRSRCLLGLAVVASVVAGSTARADFGAFDFSTTVSTAISPASPPGPTSTTSTATQGDVTIALTGQSAAGGSATAPGTDVVFGDIAVSKAGAGTQAISIAYDFRVTLTDQSPQSRADTSIADIKGMLTGTVSKTDGGALQVNIANSYAEPSYLIPTTGSFASGAIYAFLTTAFTPPGVDAGTFGGHVLVGSGPGIIPIPAGTILPEPSSLALTGLGALGAVFALRRRARA